MKLLFITATRVGDAVLSTGLLNHLIESNPGIRVTVACGPAAVSLFEAVPNVDRVIGIEKKALSLHWATLWAKCFGQFWDVLVDLRNSSMYYALLGGKRYHMTGSKEPVHRLVQLSKILGLENNPPLPKLWTGSQHDDAAVQHIPEGNPVLAMGPTANWRAKTWRAEYFAELMEKLTGPTGILPGARVAVFGHESEREMAEPLIEAIPQERCLDLVGRIDLLTVAACLKRSDLYIGNDSGLMHLAAAAGVPTLGLFGPSMEEHYGPWGSHCGVVRTEQSYDTIFPPGFDHLTSDTLMDGLSVDAVVEAATALWQRTKEAA
jgi:heptosyltransferase III